MRAGRSPSICGDARMVREIQRIEPERRGFA